MIIVAFVFLVAVAVLPVYVIGLYVYKKDKEKEPKPLLKKLFLWGMASCIPAGLAELAVSPIFEKFKYYSYFNLLIYAILGIAIIEEFGKWFVAYKCAYNNKEFEHEYDALVYCVFASLGFACLENVLFVVSSGIGTGIMRAVTAVPLHATAAIIMGNYLGKAKVAAVNNQANESKKNLAFSIIFPTLVHGVYDFCALTENYVFIVFFFGIVIGLYVYSITKIKKISKIADNFIIHNTEVPVNTQPVVNTTVPTPASETKQFAFCPYCGTKAEGAFCHNCGHKLTM